MCITNVCLCGWAQPVLQGGRGITLLPLVCLGMGNHWQLPHTRLVIITQNQKRTRQRKVGEDLLTEWSTESKASASCGRDNCGVFCELYFDNLPKQAVWLAGSDCVFDFGSSRKKLLDNPCKIFSCNEQTRTLDRQTNSGLIYEILMMEEKPIKPRHKQLTWKQLKTMETKQAMSVLGKHTNIQGVCWREDLGSGAWHSPTQHFTWCFGLSLSRTVNRQINIFRFRWQHIHACYLHLQLARPPNPYSISDPRGCQWWTL